MFLYDSLVWIYFERASQNQKDGFCRPFGFDRNVTDRTHLRPHGGLETVCAKVKSEICIPDAQTRVLNPSAPAMSNGQNRSGR